MAGQQMVLATGSCYSDLLVKLVRAVNRINGSGLAYIDLDYWLFNVVVAYTGSYSIYDGKEAIHVISKDGLELVIALDGSKFYIESIHKTICEG